MPAPSRLHPPAAEVLRTAIREAGGVEVFAIGDVDDGVITQVAITCRGREDRVTALLDRPRPGQVVIHNHPSGDLRPSDADMQLAHRYGEDGVGFVIIDQEARRANWVVEPHAPRAEPIDEAAMERFFAEGLPSALAGHEPREAQLDMARAVARALDDGAPLVVEAGTGTGKSLAYLVPAALWAKANRSRVIVSTYTRALQAQLLHSDLPLLTAGGLEVTYSVLQGRNNYACRRRLGLAHTEQTDTDDRAAIQALVDWAATATDGLRSDLPLALEPGLWERVMSDSDLTLSTRCPNYASCFYYTARRQAAASDLLVVNHALLLADRMLIDQIGRGVLPKAERVILDEAHHLEDAATGAGSYRLTALGVRRAALPLLDTQRRRGALSRLVKGLGRANGPLSAPVRETLARKAHAAEQCLRPLAATVQAVSEQIGARGLTDGNEALRITPQLTAHENWQLGIAPDVQRLAHELVQGAESLDAIEGLFDDIAIPQADAQALLDVRRARRRLVDQAGIAHAFLDPPSGTVRWVEWARSRRGDRGAAVCAAPIDVGPLLKRILWRPLPGTVCTSATLSVGGRFSFFLGRHGLDEPTTQIFPSPFDYANQVLLGLPRDLPTPEQAGYLPAVCETLTEAIRISDGGAFVLCTSHRAVRELAAALRQAFPSRPILAQGEAGRTILLDRFRENHRAVLVGTDSFWEGVSVRGRGLRLVVIPRLPFRVPTDPLRQARHEQVRARGLDPFLAYSLPEAVIKLRQGVGRLVRSRTDTGAVLILDRRIHERRYGLVMLRSLPPARRVKGPWRTVAQALAPIFALP